MAYDWNAVTDPTCLTMAGFPAVILGVLTGVLAGLYKVLLGRWRDWSKPHVPKLYLIWATAWRSDVLPLAGTERGSGPTGRAV